MIVEVRATDGDSPTTENGKLNYRINSGADGKFDFRLDSNEIITNPDAIFEYNTQNKYILNVSII